MGLRVVVVQRRDVSRFFRPRPLIHSLAGLLLLLLMPDRWRLFGLVVVAVSELAALQISRQQRCLPPRQVYTPTAAAAAALQKESHRYLFKYVKLTFQTILMWLLHRGLSVAARQAKSSKLSAGVAQKQATLGDGRRDN